MRTVCRAVAIGIGMLLIAANAEAQAPTPPAQSVTSVTIPGYHRTRAVVFQDDHTYLGVMAAGRLLWKRSLAAVPTKLLAPGPSGLFAAEVGKPGGKGYVYAYRLSHRVVRSAIRSHPGGVVTGGEGVKLSKTAFLLDRRDKSHTGSVRYRFVIRYGLCGEDYCRKTMRRQPDYPSNAYPRPNGVVRTHSGDTILIRLQVAETEAERDQGLMDVHALDPDSGMVFVWDHLVQESFWMHDTYIPLTIAWLAPDGTIQQTMDMAPLNDAILYTPTHPYLYAIEVNQGFFAQNGIKVGDRVRLSLTT